MTNSLFEPPFGGIRGNEKELVRKRVVDFLFAIIEFFSLALTVEML